MPNYTRPDELMHYGVLGMKWGVRRYQNKDYGSYTSKGLARFKEMSKSYDDAKNAYGSVKKTGDKYKIRQTKRAMKTAKRNMTYAYRGLKRDYNADQGKRLYSNGKTISSVNRRGMLTSLGVTIGSTIATQAVGKHLNNKHAVLITKKMGTIPLSAISSAAISTGALVANGINTAKTISDRNKLRAYYGHSHTSKKDRR